MFSGIKKLFMVCIMLIVVCLVNQGEAGTWTQKADMPTARSIAGSAVVDGKIYVIGGAPVPFKATRAVEEYDPKTDTWKKCADMPTIRQGLYAATVDGIIYAIGGCEVAPGVDRDISTVEAYDPAIDTWTRKADMPTARTLSAIAVVDGIIYVIGGAFDDNYLDGVNVEILSTVEAYNPATDTWTKRTDMPTARYVHSACVIDGRIYVSGGTKIWSQDSVPDIPTVEVYDPATDTWTQAQDMPMSWQWHSACALDGKMYIIGGYNHELGTQFNEGKLTMDEAIELFSMVYVYDPAADTWTTTANIPTPRNTPATAVVDGRIYAIGGNSPSGFYSTVEEFTPGPPDSVSSVRPGGSCWRRGGGLSRPGKSGVGEMERWGDRSLALFQCPDYGGKIMKSIVIGLTVFLLATSVWAGTLKDDFEDGDMDEWDVLGGGAIWEVKDGEFVITARNFPSLFCIGETTWGNYTVRVKSKIAKHQQSAGNVESGGILVRREFQLRTYCFAFGERLGFGKIVCAFYSSGNLNAMHWISEPFEWELGKWYDLKVTAEGDQFWFYVDNQLVIHYTDDTYPKGKAGLQASFNGTSVHYDDFSVTGDDVPDMDFSVSSEGKLAIRWGLVKGR